MYENYFIQAHTHIYYIKKINLSSWWVHFIYFLKGELEIISNLSSHTSIIIGPARVPAKLTHSGFSSVAQSDHEYIR